MTNLQTGDILHCTGKSWISRAIRWWTKSKYSHTSMYLEVWGQPYIVDAQKDGFNLRPYYKWVEKYDYDFDVSRSPATGNSNYRKDLAKRALTKVGVTAYDFESLLLRQPYKIITGKWRKRKKESNRMYCSEAIAWIHGVKDAYKMSPQDLYEHCVLHGFKTL